MIEVVVLVPHPHVVVDRKILGGSPHVRGTRVLVRALYLRYREGGQPEQLARRYRMLSMAQVLDALAFALDNVEAIEQDIERAKAVKDRVLGRPEQGREKKA